MARPRKASDSEIFAATQQVMMRLSPTQWTLADVAGEVGLTAGALVQRFGSKRALLINVAERWASESPAALEQLRDEHSSPLAALFAYAQGIACMGESPDMLAHHLSYLQNDLVDPELRLCLRSQAEAGREFFVELLDDAVAAGELTESTDTAVLARAVETAVNGSLMTWAIYQDGSAEEWMERDLESTLSPYRAPQG